MFITHIFQQLFKRDNKLLNDALWNTNETTQQNYA